MKTNSNAGGKMTYKERLVLMVLRLAEANLTDDEVKEWRFITMELGRLYNQVNER